MLECVDGPLAGHRVTRRRLPSPGQAVTVGVVDVEHALLAVEYRLDGPPVPDGAHLRFVGAREVRRRRRGLDRLALR